MLYCKHTPLLAAMFALHAALHRKHTPSCAASCALQAKLSGLQQQMQAIAKLHRKHTPL